MPIPSPLLTKSKTREHRAAFKKSVKSGLSHSFYSKSLVVVNLNNYV